MMAGRVVRLGLPVVAVAAVLCGVGWMLASQQSAEAAPGKAAARTSISASKYDRVSANGNVFYKVPAGYRAVQQDGGVIMVPAADIARGEFNGYLLLTQGFALDARTRASFRGKSRPTVVQALAIAIGGLSDVPGVKMSTPKLVNTPATDGYEAYLLNSQSDDRDAGSIRFAQYAVIITGDRAEIAMRVAYGSQQRMERLGTAFDALLGSMEFRNAGAPPPARLAGPLPTDLASIAPRPAPVRSGGGGGAESGGNGGVVCRAEPRTRSYISPVFGGGGPLVSSYIGAARVCRKNGRVVDVR